MYKHQVQALQTLEIFQQVPLIPKLLIYSLNATCSAGVLS